jgi:hypothetical protein
MGSSPSAGSGSTADTTGNRAARADRN